MRRRLGCGLTVGLGILVGEGVRGFCSCIAGENTDFHNGIDLNKRQLCQIIVVPAPRIEREGNDGYAVNSQTKFSIFSV